MSGFPPASSPKQPAALPLKPNASSIVQVHVEDGYAQSLEASRELVAVKGKRPEIGDAVVGSRGGEHPPQEAADEGPPSQRLRSCLLLPGH